MLAHSLTVVSRMAQALEVNDDDFYKEKYGDDVFQDASESEYHSSDEGILYYTIQYNTIQYNTIPTLFISVNTVNGMSYSVL